MSGNRHHDCPRCSLVEDKAALLAFKKFVLIDPKSMLADWEAGVHVCNFTGSHTLVLNRNNLNGLIPDIFFLLTGLTVFAAMENNLTGQLPASLTNTTLYNLDVEYNHLSGELPSDLVSKLPDLLELAGMGLGERLPGSIGHPSLKRLKLQENRIFGSIPPEIGNLSNITMLNLTSNFLNGTPEEFGLLLMLERLFLSGNLFKSRIPLTLGKLPHHDLLDLSNNGFNGEIPASLGDLVALRSLNDSFWWHLRFGHIYVVLRQPAPMRSGVHSMLCDRNPPRKTNEFFQEKWKLKKASNTRINAQFPRIAHKELSNATGGFDDWNLIGTSSYGRVYKGVLQDGNTIAVKLLPLQSGNSTKSFNRECQVLKRIQHRNLIRIITACSLPDFKALVLPYMANGSLDSHLYPHSESCLGSGYSNLSLIQRVRICGDIAEGMAYLHHHPPVRVIHCDLKPGNVLLKDNMTALVSDFGIARLVVITVFLVK
ncbi:hypothetical protein F3Y22_tig00116991pilonHSYRG00006 [Hibiscus syriacus]|uniref:Protein kinase domain-containing protein n=1 Tax=Hibiscus syriacus TaxID=106335 RepID=A0A6A2WHH4_HIBSY|nr:hypothetical protein F3Y22_tig00116991pilonHSYRG00006 [Hibiscus syriacus]